MRYFTSIFSVSFYLPCLLRTSPRLSLSHIAHSVHIKVTFDNEGLFCLSLRRKRILGPLPVSQTLDFLGCFYEREAAGAAGLIHIVTAVPL